jgi:hypothetical protein
MVGVDLCVLGDAVVGDAVATTIPVGMTGLVDDWLSG